MSKREELRLRRQREAQRRQIVVIVAGALVLVAAAAFLVYANTRPATQVVVPEKQAYPYPDGKALGPAGAPVVIQEFSDFQ